MQGKGEKEKGKNEQKEEVNDCKNGKKKEKRLQWEKGKEERGIKERVERMGEWRKRIKKDKGIFEARRRKEALKEWRKGLEDWEGRKVRIEGHIRNCRQRN